MPSRRDSVHSISGPSHPLTLVNQSRFNAQAAPSAPVHRPSNNHDLLKDSGHDFEKALPHSDEEFDTKNFTAASEHITPDQLPRPALSRSSSMTYMEAADLGGQDSNDNYAARPARLITKQPSSLWDVVRQSLRRIAYGRVEVHRRNMRVVVLETEAQAKMYGV